MATVGNLGYLAEAQVSNVPRERCGNYVYGTFGRVFTTADGARVMVVVLTKPHWHDLLSVTGLSEAVETLAPALGADFSLESDRFKHRTALGGLIAEWFGRRTYGEVESVLKTTRVLWTKYQSFSDLAADGARLLRAGPLFAEVHQPGVETHLAPGSPLVMDGEQSLPKPSPLVGEHTDELLRNELGLSEAELKKLHDDGVVGLPQSAEAVA